MKKKKCKSNSLFLIYFKTHTPKKCMFGAAMNQILHRKKNQKNFRIQNLSKISKTPKKVEGASAEVEILHGEYRVKKLKIAASAEAPFRVKMDF